MDALAPRTDAEIVVVAYGAPQLLQNALAPLAGEFPITVVDNSSLPEIAQIAAQQGAVYLCPGVNLGFAGGVNTALRHRQNPGSDVLLLNPDAVISPLAVRTLQARLHAADRIASVGPVQVDEQGNRGPVSWPYPSPRRALAEATRLRWLAPEEPRYVIGSVLLLNGAAVAEIGRFDDSFFLYDEEADWAFRAQQAGWRHEVVTEAVAHHVGGGTSSNEYRREVFRQAGRERFLRKHYGWVGWQFARIVTVAGGLLRQLFQRGSQRHLALAKARLFAHGPVRVERHLRSCMEYPQ